MDSCKKCNKILYYEPSCDGMCMECWENFGRLELLCHAEEPTPEWAFELDETGTKLVPKNKLAKVLFPSAG